MAVKHKVVENRESQDSDRLNTILRALQNIHSNSEQPLSNGELSKMCEKIVECLGTVNMPKSPENYVNFMENVQKIQEFLAQACSSQQLIFATLKALYNDISDPQKDPSATMSIVLQLIDTKCIPVAVRWILHGYSEASLEQALLTLCKWLSTWTWTPNLGPLVLCFMEGLELEQHYDILVEVTVKYIERLFKLIILPPNRKFVAPVVFHMLRSMQHSPEAFHKIVPHVKSVLTSLSKENTESSHACEEEIANLCIALMRLFPGYPIYDQLNDVLEHYSPTMTCKQILNCKSWQDGSTALITIPYTSEKVGLNNLGNTCYMNSVLQALFMTKLFRNDILKSTRDAITILSKLQSLFALLQFSKRPSLSPNEILNIARPPGFQPGHQHDSSEFLGYLLDVLHEQERVFFMAGQSGDGPSISGHMGEAAAQLVTMVQKSFGGRGVTVSRCDTCSHQSERADNFRDIQLSFPSNTDNQSVQTLINYYLQPESLCGDNQYHCDRCQRLTDGARVTRLVEPPRRLVLTLKQFRYDPTSQLRTKILQRVNLDNVIHVESVQYELYAAVVHYGCSVDSGHYYTFARDDQDWYKFNDCSVVKTKAEELHSLKPPETPYILFYRRLECVEPEALQQTELSNRLQTLLFRDSSDFESERRRRQKINSSRISRKDDDEPPPPGCGGGGILDNSHNRFVC